MIKLYTLVTFLLTPFLPLLARARLKRGKEDSNRISERFGIASVPRPEGKLIWIHAASIGEMNTVKKLYQELIIEGSTVLLTTMTKTASDLAFRKGIFHQFIPFDSPLYMQRFYAHWQPDLIILTEQELWLNLINQAKAPIIVVNGRISEKSFLKWQKFPKTAKKIFGKIKLVLAQSDEDKARFQMLGAETKNIGNLKFDAMEARTASHLNRPTWIAASTHEGEELMAVRIHEQLKKHYPNLLTLICPRHAERGGAIMKSLNHFNLLIHQRSKGKEIKPETDVYLIDTFGELNAFLALAPITFMGKSIYATGGQNPIEAILAGSAVITGEKTSNFNELYQKLESKNALVKVKNEADLKEKLAHLFEENEARKTLNNNALQFVFESKGTLTKTLKELEAFR